MATWRYSVLLADENDAFTRKNWYGDFADYTAAAAAAAALLTDIQAATTAGVQTTELTLLTTVAEAAGAGSNVFEVANATLQLNDLKKANFKLPSPVDTIFTGNALDIADTVWTDLMANFTSAAGWELSDGDHYVSSIKGSRAFVSSGKTNVP